MSCIATGAPCLSDLVRTYLLAKQQVISSGFEHEIYWQESAALGAVTSRVFLREAAWVILCSGMRESVINARFGRLSQAFEDWDVKRIVRNRSRCWRKALGIFNYPAKIDAIICIAAQLAELGVDEFVRGIEDEGPGFLTCLPYIGPTTCYHLAKNLGFPVAKPDRHLERIAGTLGFAGTSQLCSAIADFLDEPIQVVDLVIWRFATINKDYLSWIRQAIAGPPQSKLHAMQLAR